MITASATNLSLDTLSSQMNYMYSRIIQLEIVVCDQAAVITGLQNKLDHHLDSQHSQVDPSLNPPTPATTNSESGSGPLRLRDPQVGKDPKPNLQPKITASIKIPFQCLPPNSRITSDAIIDTLPSSTADISSGQPQLISTMNAKKGRELPVDRIDLVSDGEDHVKRIKLEKSLPTANIIRDEISNPESLDLNDSPEIGVYSPDHIHRYESGTPIFCKSFQLQKCKNKSCVDPHYCLVCGRDHQTRFCNRKCLEDS
ncbi:hypothetical protein BDR26DRAFT_193762 [Obelidium mucronatum]|nr:hypothetical protein BDR26DRAFT_193762 [Obelidium mucronatum]